MIYYNELYHHGVKGMHWGVRKKYESTDSGNSHGSKSGNGTGKKVAKGLAIVGATALTTYALSNKKTRDFILKNGKKLGKSIKDNLTSDETKAFIKKTSKATGKFLADKGGKTVKFFGERVTKAGAAMTDAALLSIGTIQISKLSEKLADNPNDSEHVRNQKKIMLDTATAGITAATSSSGGKSNGGKSNGGKEVGKEVSDRLGQPSNKGIDRSSSSYQNLFKDNNGNQRDAETRSVIKSLAQAGYDIDQIKIYLNDVDNGRIKHSDLSPTNTYVGKLYIENYIL